MKKLLLVPVFLLLLTFVKMNTLTAQVQTADSLALVEFYNELDGPNWIDNSNWLTSQPLDSWFGIMVEAGRVVRIELPSNFLRGQVPASINTLTDLEFLILFDNVINGLPFLSSLTLLQELAVEDNALVFGDLEDNAGLGIPMFTYAPQREFDRERFLTKPTGSDVTWSTPAGGIFSEYQWFLDGNPVGLPMGDPNYTINSISSADAGAYTSEVSNTMLPGLILISLPQNLNIGPCTDTLGGTYNCQEMLITFEPSATQSFKDSLLNAIGATRIDSCKCGEIELWDLADTVNLEGTVKTSKTDPKVEETGFNYVVEIPFNQPFVQGDPVPPGPFMPVFPSGNEVKVAIIDSGIQYDHPDLENYMWLNDTEYPPDGNSDDDLNCYIDDFRGWDFLNDDNDPYDDHGHGTHIAGIVADDMNPNISIMNLQAFGSTGKSSLFNAACAIYYAADKGARVINTSWGYYGEESLMLRDAVEYAGANCGALVVASAGNNGVNVDSIPHYPSGHNLTNVISVAALDLGENALASFSNFGDSTVNIAAVGTQVFSTIPYNSYDPKDGTSMAAGEVSLQAAKLFLDDPSATYQNVKSALLNTATPIPGGAALLTTRGKVNASAAQGDLITSPYLGDCGIYLDIEVMLEGPFDPLNVSMDNELWTAGAVPLNQPYNVAPWNYGGTETIGAAGLALTGNDEFVDWVLLIFGDPNDETAEPITMAALVQKDGDVTDPDGNLITLETNQASHLAIVHRNHLGIMSLNPIAYDTQPTRINFTTGATTAFGSSPMKTVGGSLVMIAGDANRDGTINVVDLNNHWRLQNGTPFTYGGSTADFNLDESINSVDLNTIWRVNNSLISSCPLCY
ncbi:MAG: S8 family serine peptidase [Bacteroidota bacterium]